SGAQGALQVAAEDGIQVLVGQRLARTLGLPQADVIERNVQMTLNASVNIPGSFAMADGDDAGSVHAAGAPMAPEFNKQSICRQAVKASIVRHSLHSLSVSGKQGFLREDR